MRKAPGLVGSVALATVLAGCGSSGSGAPDAGTPGGGGACKAAIQPNAFMSWTLDGAKVCANSATATLLTSSSSGSLSVTGATSAGMGVSLNVFLTGGTVAASIYACGGGMPGQPVVNLNYQMSQMANFATSCSIMVTSPGGAGGAHALGTFTAEVPIGGAPKTITGMFDIPATLVAN